MRPQITTLVSTDTGDTSEGIVTSYRSKNGTFNIGAQVKISTGAATVQVTMDNPDDFAKVHGVTPSWDADATWTTANSGLSGLTASASGTITSNCFGVRLISGSDTDFTAVLTVLQD